MTDIAVGGMQSAWQVALQQYDRAADKLNLGAAVREVLRYPKREAAETPKPKLGPSDVTRTT